LHDFFIVASPLSFPPFCSSLTRGMFESINKQNNVLLNQNKQNIIYNNCKLYNYLNIMFFISAFATDERIQTLSSRGRRGLAPVTSRFRQHDCSLAFPVIKTGDYLPKPVTATILSCSSPRSGDEVRNQFPSGRSNSVGAIPGIMAPTFRSALLWNSCSIGGTVCSSLSLNFIFKRRFHHRKPIGMICFRSYFPLLSHTCKPYW
jgi:hypothetical protein